MESQKHTQKENLSQIQQGNAQLAGRLAHEKKNPLSTIKINLKLIAEDLSRLIGIRGHCLQTSAGPERLDEDKLISANAHFTEK